MVGGFGPTISAIIITYIISGSKGLKSQADRIISWRASPVWCLFVLFSPAAIVLLAIGIYVMIGGTVPQFNDPAQWYLIPIAFSYVFVFTALGEEPGWRGFALPGLQSGSNALKSSLILGVIWGTWHLPLFLMKGNFHNQVHLIAFMVQIIAMTVLYTWIYQWQPVSSLCFHAAGNSTLGMLPIMLWVNGGDVTPLWIAVGLLCIVTLAVVTMGQTGFQGKQTRQH